MLNFLDRHAKAMAGAFVEQEGGNRKRPLNFRESKFDQKRAKSFGSSERHSESKPEGKSCVVCKESHAVHKCSTFLKLNLTERRKKVKDLELCYNCLNPSHTSKECKSSVCRRCEKKHNSLLCPENPFNRSVNNVQSRTSSKKVVKKGPTPSKL